MRSLRRLLRRVPAAEPVAPDALRLLMVCMGR